MPIWSAPMSIWMSVSGTGSLDRKSTRLNSSHLVISYAVFCLKKNSYTRTIPNIAAEVVANLQSPLPKSFVDLAVDGFGGYEDFYKNDVAAIFASVKDPELQKQLAEVDAAAAQAMAQLKNHFVVERKTANENFALGKDLFAAMLRETEHVDLPIDQ